MNISLKLSDWHSVEQWLDAQTALTIPPSYLERATKPQYPRDAFSLGQLASKAWLLENADTVHTGSSKLTVALLGCWIGALVEPLCALTPRIQRVYGFDVDPAVVELSEQFNQRLVQDSWRYKGVVADVSLLETHQMEFETGGELISVKPEVVINTSCEHMGTEWFETADSDQLIIMQTNNSPDFEGHVNTCASVGEMRERYPLRECLLAGSLELPVYTRFMQIGYK